MAWGKRPQDKIAHDYDFLAFNAWSKCGMAVWPKQDVARTRKGQRCKSCARSRKQQRCPNCGYETSEDRNGDPG